MQGFLELSPYHSEAHTLAEETYIKDRPPSGLIDHRHIESVWEPACPKSRREADTGATSEKNKLTR